MSKRRVLDVLAEKHEDWMNMARSFGLSNDDAGEIVQGMYLKMNEYIKDVDKIMYNEDKVNTFYVYKTMNNLFLSGYHLNGNLGKFKASKISYVSNLFDLDDDRPDNYNSEEVEGKLSTEIQVKTLKAIRRAEIEGSVNFLKEEKELEDMRMFEALYSNLKDDVDCFIDSWYWYESKMFRLYFYKDMSMREISRETKISLTSICLTIKHCKKMIIDEFGEDYERYLKNKEY